MSRASEVYPILTLFCKVQTQPYQCGTSLSPSDDIICSPLSNREKFAKVLCGYGDGPGGSSLPSPRTSSLIFRTNQRPTYGQEKSKPGAPVILESRWVGHPLTYRSLSTTPIKFKYVKHFLKEAAWARKMCRGNTRRSRLSKRRVKAKSCSFQYRGMWFSSCCCTEKNGEWPRHCFNYQSLAIGL